MKGGKGRRERSSRWKKSTQRQSAQCTKERFTALVLLDSQIIMSVINEIFLSFSIFGKFKF